MAVCRRHPIAIAMTGTLGRAATTTPPKRLVVERLVMGTKVPFPTPMARGTVETPPCCSRGSGRPTRAATPLSHPRCRSAAHPSGLAGPRDLDRRLAGRAPPAPRRRSPRAAAHEGASRRRRRGPARAPAGGRGERPAAGRGAHSAQRPRRCYGWLTNLVHCPWLAKPYCAQPPFLHCSLDVGSGGASNTVARPRAQGVWSAAERGAIGWCRGRTARRSSRHGRFRRYRSASRSGCRIRTSGR